ncbi:MULTISPECIES: gamma-glutamylcyclotransferase family protein [Streptomyces]|uniref:Gamma-glutamylcyclotransferase AIG2-like domain-containing protein n=1 Tax=Streptomyces venezuelae TaxID=54571 RepID=A0A5P2B930_STRVZ|nr:MULTISPECIES: gamma-glutamylcyclotransferase family protein [Streptomyces]NEA00750.1 gamma-glutamylcyclotransferase [Streptomyces sp. SID10116]MYY82658.1 gamma-glutamylcyclotransferase [Streptomyces sp. SID335]MYZ13667.1 gamma-glutamylcyclotransferase [Streptomyces sp. SID337]NDZ87625.1 gamma-glutamylcyclotransferase [Streptomyces sp. SID10115]NEB45090.1 gamma-glutamylcyclotransferase [Streptomyces sp. SID339]
MSDDEPGTARLPFFVYGTLRPGEPNHAVHLHGRTAKEESALLPDALLYDGPGYPYAVEHPGKGPVRGELLTALPTANAPLLTALDLLEEYIPGDPHNLYERVVRDVLDRTGAPVRAWVYVAAPRIAAGLRASGSVIGTGDWAAHRKAQLKRLRTRSSDLNHS